MNVAIYNNGIPFHGNSPVEGPLGGSESGIVYMARELAAIGHAVSVYCDCPERGYYDGVHYQHQHRFFEEFRVAPWDVFISFRSFDPFLVGRIAPRTIFWTGDAFDQPAISKLGHPVVQENIDLHFCVSEWQRSTFIDAFHLPPEKVIATRNGFRKDLLPPKGRSSGPAGFIRARRSADSAVCWICFPGSGARFRTCRSTFSAA